MEKVVGSLDWQAEPPATPQQIRQLRIGGTGAFGCLWGCLCERMSPKLTSLCEKSEETAPCGRGSVASPLIPQKQSGFYLVFTQTLTPGAETRPISAHFHPGAGGPQLLDLVH